MPFLFESFLSLAVVIGLGMFGAVPAPPPHETILYSFTGGSDGATPNGSLIGDARAALYGTTFYGGSNACYEGCGTVFKLVRSGRGYTKEILYRFAGGSDGENPSGGLLPDASGALYGVTRDGGNTDCHSEPCGVVFKLTPARSNTGYTESVLYRFQGTPNDGAAPLGSLVMDAAGTLYGVTGAGGKTNYGTVYKLTKTDNGYRETVLRSFALQDGGPAGELLVDARGRLVGATRGVSGGVVFEFVPFGPRYLYRVLYRFQKRDDGLEPLGGVIEDANGALWGTTSYGGGWRDDGTVFKLSPSGQTYAESVMYRFGYRRHHGRIPAGPLLAGSGGALYGVTTYGGGFPSCFLGCGVVFELRPHDGHYEERVLHHFENSPDGGFPDGGLLMLPDSRVLYGATTEGGLTNCYPGCGTVFAIHL